MSNSGGEMQLAIVQQWPPSGWTLEIRESPSGRKDKYYISPNGIKFDSKVKVCRYLGMEGDDVPIERGKCSNVIRVARKEKLGKAMEWLPPDWEVEFTKRKDGRIDKSYIDPLSGLKFRSTKEVSRYLQFGEVRGGRRAKKKCVDDVESSDQEFTLSSRAKVRKLPRKIKRRSLFTEQSSNKNKELVLKSANAAFWEEEEGCDDDDDRHTMFHPSVANELESSMKDDDACTTVTCAVPLASLYPEMVQPIIAKREKRKTKLLQSKAQSEKEPVKKKPKPNPPYPKRERVIPSRTSRRIAGLKPELSSENRSEEVPMEVSTKVDTVPGDVVVSTEVDTVPGDVVVSTEVDTVPGDVVVSTEVDTVPGDVVVSTEVDTVPGDVVISTEVDTVPGDVVVSTEVDTVPVDVVVSTEVDTVPGDVVHELGMIIHDAHIKLPRCEEEEIVSYADIESSGLDEQENIISIMRKKKRVRKKKHTDDGLQLLKNYLEEDDDDEEKVLSAGTKVRKGGSKPLGREKQKTTISSKKKRKHIDSHKGKKKTGKIQAPMASERSSKVEVSMPELIEATVKWLGGKYIEWIYEKEITTSDVNKAQARLYLPIEIENFLSETEKNYLKEKPRNGLEVVVVDHKSETWDMLVKYWPSVENYILVKNWPQFIDANDIQAGKHVAEMWTFRQCLSQDEQVEDGNKKKGKLGFAINFRGNELGDTPEDDFYLSLEDDIKTLEFEISAPETTSDNPEEFSVVTSPDVDHQNNGENGVHSHSAGRSPETSRGNNEEDPWKTHAEEYSRKAESNRRSGTVLTLPSCESALDPCIEFAYKTLTGMIPMEHLPVNLMRQY